MHFFYETIWLQISSLVDKAFFQKMISETIHEKRLIHYLSVVNEINIKKPKTLDVINNIINGLFFDGIIILDRSSLYSLYSDYGLTVNNTFTNNFMNFISACKQIKEFLDEYTQDRFDKDIRQFIIKNNIFFTTNKTFRAKLQKEKNKYRYLNDSFIKNSFAQQEEKIAASKTILDTYKKICKIKYNELSFLELVSLNESINSCLLLSKPVVVNRLVSRIC